MITCGGRGFAGESPNRVYLASQDREEEQEQLRKPQRGSGSREWICKPARAQAEA